MIPIHRAGARTGAAVAERYHLGSLLGRGGSGEVYAARDTKSGQPVAVKLLHDHLSQDRMAAERFLREARSATQLHHPNVVTVYDFGQDVDGTVYIIEELLHGVSLREFLHRCRVLSVEQVLAKLLPIFDALALAHAQKMVHRDVKPENIFLAETASGEIPKLIDFGLARAVAGAQAPSTVTTDGMVMGTVEYISPEQLRGERDLDGRCDIWALGIVLFEMLSGQRPFVGASQNEVIAQILGHRPPRLDQVASDVTPALSGVVERCLERDKDHRFPSISALRDALQAAANTTAPAPDHFTDPHRRIAIVHPRRQTIRWGLLVILGIAAAMYWIMLRRPSLPAAPRVAPSPPNFAADPAGPTLVIPSGPPRSPAASLPAATDQKGSSLPHHPRRPQTKSPPPPTLGPNDAPIVH